MKKRVLKVIMGAAMLVAPLAQTNAVLAWGPSGAERPTFTMEKPATYPTFNSITNNPVMGDERDFVRIVEKGSGGTFNSHQEIEAGKEYVVSIYIHNNASATFNDKAHDYSGVARDVRVVSYFPTELAAGVEGKVDGMVISSNAKPQKVWDEAYITPKEDVKISYVAGTARIQNDWDADGTVLSDKLFTKEGVFIGLNELNGVILGCEAYSSLIFYTLKVEAATTPVTPPIDPVDPVDPTTPTDPVDPDVPVIPADPVDPGKIDEIVDVVITEPEEVPEALPVAGPTEIALVIVLVVLIACCGFWFAKTHRVKETATRGNKSKKTTGRKKK